MNQIIMDELVKGTAEWVHSVFQTAAKKGLVILFLAGTSIGGIIAVIYLLKQAECERKEFRIELKQQISEVRNEYRGELAACNKAREDISVRFAALAAEVAVLKRNQN